MKTAKEMFEELGYAKIEFSKYGNIGWEGDFYDDYHEEWYTKSFLFDNVEKEITEVGSKTKLNELKAVYQQVKELGWLDDDE